ncbi:hypothetical protein D3C84_305540 [compost metagenome]
MKNRLSGRFFLACEKVRESEVLLMHTKIVCKIPIPARPTRGAKLTFKSMK